MATQRRISADLIRVIAASAVIVMHITSLVYYDLDLIGYRWWLFSNVLNWGLRWSTPVFVMISGYFLLNSDTSSHTKTFFRRRFSKLIPPYLFWSLIYYLISHQGQLNIFSVLDFLDKLWRSSTYYHLYFINVILGLYLVTPFIKKHLLGKNLNFIVPLLLFCSTVYLVGYTYFGVPQVSNILTWFIPYLGFYIAGYWIGRMTSPKRPLLYLFIGLMMIFITVMVTKKTFFLFDNQETKTVLAKHFSPTITIAALSFFYFVINIKNKTLGSLSGLASLSNLSLGVYFIHPLWIILLSRMGFIANLYLDYYGLWLISIICLSVTASFLSVLFLKKLPYIKSIV